MTISMYSASVPLFKRQLGALLNWLDKAEAHAKERQFDANNYLQLRLAPDMLPFVSQIRIASDGSIQIGDISVVMLGVVNVHRPGINARFQGVFSVREGR